MNTKPIEFDNLTVVYETSAGNVTALKQLSLTVEPGTVFGFLGPNGAGKTTAMHVLLGFQPPTDGQARLFGHDAHSVSARRRIGYLAEQPDAYRFLSGREFLRFIGRLCGLRGSRLEDRIRAALNEVKLAGAADRRLGRYSRGMRQRLGLAQAILHEPDLLILDEPTGGLDPLARRQIRALIEQWRQAGKTIFFSSHELSEVEMVCDTIGILANGQLRAIGRPGDLIPEGRTFEQYFLETVASFPSNPKAPGDHES